MRATLEWFGTATWRLTVGRTVFWLDAYLDRAPTAPPLPLRAAGVDRASYVLIGHSHFDHIAGAGAIALRTGATVVGSALSCEIVRDEGVDEQLTRPVSGGEKLRLGPVTVRVYPSLHGFNGLREYPDERGMTRKERTAVMRAHDPGGCAAALAHLRDIPEKQRHDGGPLAYLLEWDDFRLFWHDTPGMVTASWEAAAAREPDLAILAAAAAFSSPNLDGHPFEDPGPLPPAASIAQSAPLDSPPLSTQHSALSTPQRFVAYMATILQPGRVILNHHDDWCPPVTFHLPEETFRPGLELAGVQLDIHPLAEPFPLE
jgi:L-ascorbate metabolism protein UlaG (beta-lactamase superfamily)